MRIRTIPILLAGALAATACGGSGQPTASVAQTPPPVNLSVYVSDTRVSVSPSSLGAGPVEFVVANEARRAEALTITRAGEARPLASTAPINPQGTTQVQLTFTPGDYTIAVSPGGLSHAQVTPGSAIAPASIHVGRERAGGGNQLLGP
jgi:hypothetical protein